MLYIPHQNPPRPCQVFPNSLPLTVLFSRNICSRAKCWPGLQSAPNSGNILPGSRSWPDWYLASQQYLVDPRQAKEDKSRPHNRRSGQDPTLHSFLPRDSRIHQYLAECSTLTETKFVHQMAFLIKEPKVDSAETVFSPRP